MHAENREQIVGEATNQKCFACLQFVRSASSGHGSRAAVARLRQSSSAAGFWSNWITNYTHAGLASAVEAAPPIGAQSRHVFSPV